MVLRCGIRSTSAGSRGVRAALGALLVAAAFTRAVPSRAESATEVWMEAGVQGDLTDRLRLRFSQQLRYRGALADLDRVMPELALRYETRPWLRLGTSYRLSRQWDGDDWTHRHRVDADALLRGRAGSLRLSHRTRMQHQLRGLEGDGGFRAVLRQRLGVSHRPLAWLEPFADAEAFFLLAHPKRGYALRSWRVTAGADLEAGPVDLEAAYRLELPVDVEGPTVHIVALTAIYSL